MLKPGDSAVGPTGPDADRPVGDLVHQLVEDGKAYARAEVKFARTVATVKAKALAVPAALIVLGILFVLAGFGVLATGVMFALEPLLGPLLAGIATFLIFAAIGGGLIRFAIGKAEDDL